MTKQNKTKTIRKFQKMSLQGGVPLLLSETGQKKDFVFCQNGFRDRAAIEDHKYFSKKTQK